jgi:single-stranded-DNA-specific exonuclease
MSSKNWIVAEPIIEDAKKQFPEIDPAVLQLLWNRGLKTQEQIDIFWGPDWSRDTHSPDLFLNMPAAVAKVFASLEARDIITVHGDYDADGVCGSAVLISTLREICRAFGFDETKITSYIPHREKEGYGMSVPTVEHLHQHEKTKLVITVDCGISNKPAIERGAELGIATVVCDHHTIPDQLPQTAILLHPLVPGEQYPNKNLCGTGVAFKLACGLIAEARKRGAKFPDGHEKWLLDLVAIATVTDVMPLTGENRVLEHYGLMVLNKTKRVGLQKLMDVAGCKMGELDTYAIGFQIGPRINAAGRMDHANGALYLLIEEDPVKAGELAQALQAANVARQKASEEMYQQAKRQIGDVGDRKILVVVGEGWPAGLVGLVAGKLVGDFGRPTYVVGKDGEKYVGSGRSIEGFDVTKALHHAEEQLDKFGGHPQACGFSTTGSDRFEKAVALMTAFAEQELSGRDMAPSLRADAQIDLVQADWKLQEAVEQFAPFGEGNPRPVFVSREVEVCAFDTVGNGGKHLRLTVRSPRGKIARMIGFGFGSRASTLKIGQTVSVAYEIGVNEWNGNRELQLRIVDMV